MSGCKSLPKTWKSPPEVAEELGIAVEKVHTWIRAGELEAVNIGTTTTGRPRWKISQDAIDAFLEARRQRRPVKPVRRKKRAGMIAFY